jgi:cytoskeletal protein RodZ
VIIAFEIIQVVEGNTLVPLVMSRAAKLNPLVVIVAVVIGGSVLGIGGAALAVPVAVVVQLLILRLLAPLARNASGTDTIETNGATKTTQVATTTQAFGATTTTTTTLTKKTPAPHPAGPTDADAPETETTPVASSSATEPAPTQAETEQPV